MNIFLAPHSDDEALFGSFIIQRAKPEVYIVTDGTSHEEKFGIDRQQRRDESIKAMERLGVKVHFIAVGESEVTEELLKTLFHKEWGAGLVFAPALQGGHKHHDMVSNAASAVFGSRVIYYATYSKDSLHTTGEMALTPTVEELKLKEQVLSCYESQIKINGHHFEAVKGKPEYLSFNQC